MTERLSCVWSRLVCHLDFSFQRERPKKLPEEFCCSIELAVPDSNAPTGINQKKLKDYGLQSPILLSSNEVEVSCERVYFWFWSSLKSDFQPRQRKCASSTARRTPWTYRNRLQRRTQKCSLQTQRINGSSKNQIHHLLFCKAFFVARKFMKPCLSRFRIRHVGSANLADVVKFNVAVSKWFQW